MIPKSARGGLNATGRPHGGVDGCIAFDEDVFLEALSMAETMQPPPVMADSMQTSEKPE
jgi:hypothetical protein